MFDPEYLLYIDSVREEGRQGYAKGFPNPYPFNSSEYTAWESGYYDALHQQEGDVCGYHDDYEPYEPSPYNGDDLDE